MGDGCRAQAAVSASSPSWVRIWQAWRRILRASERAARLPPLRSLSGGVVVVVGGRGAGVGLPGLIDRPAQHLGSAQDGRPGGPLQSEDQTVRSSPANRTALREEENRQAPRTRQQVMASPVTGPTRTAALRAPWRRSGSRAAASSRCRSTSRRACSAASMSKAVATCRCPPGTSTPRPPRAAPRDHRRCAARPRPGPGRPGGRTPRGCAAPRRCAQPEERDTSRAAPGIPGCGTAITSTPAAGPRPEAPAGAVSRSCRSSRAACGRGPKRYQPARPRAP